MEKEKGRSVLIIVVVVLVIINLLSLAAGVILFQKYVNSNEQTVVDYASKITPPASDIADLSSTPMASSEPQFTGTPDITEAPSPTVVHEPVAAKHVENLAHAILEAELPEGAEAIVSVLDGKEYLKIIIDGYSIYYRNDYVKYGEEPYGRVIIEKGRLSKTFDWDYSLEADNIASLVPVIFDWRENKREQMAFVFKKLEDGEEERTGVHFVTCADLIEYTTLTPENGFVSSISIDGFVETDKETLVCVVNESRKYYISAGKKLTEAEKNEISLSVINDVKYTMLNERVFVSTKVYLKNIGWIGEISARVTYSTFDIFGNHSNVFYCYAEQSIMAQDEMLVITPVEDYEATRQTKILITGDAGEKMILFAKEGIEASWQDPSLFKLNENGYMEYKDDSVYTAWGVDVSKFNATSSKIDWKKVKNAGFSFAIIRMGYRGYGGGSLQTDPKFVENIEGALNAGLQVGVYYFTQAITMEEAVEEANAIVNAIRKYNVKYPVIIDTEYYSGVEARANYMPMQQRTDIIKAFCETVEAAGYTPMIYSSTNWSILNYDRSQLGKYDFWYAYYGINLDYPYHYEILQYASDGSVPGIEGKVDINISFKNYGK